MMEGQWEFKMIIDYTEIWGVKKIIFQTTFLSVQEIYMI